MKHSLWRSDVKLVKWWLAQHSFGTASGKTRSTMEGNNTQEGVPTEHQKKNDGRHRLHNGANPSEEEHIQRPSSSLRSPLERELLQSWRRFPVQERMGDKLVDGCLHQTPGRIKLPRDLQIRQHRPCTHTVLLGGGTSTVTASGAREEAQHLAEWEAFVMLILRVHGCIRQVQFNIWMSSMSTRPFYRSFQIQDGCVIVDLQTAAMREPSRMYGIPFYLSQIMDEGLPGINLPRLIKVVKETPFLDKVVLCVHNTTSEPRTSRAVSKIVGLSRKRETKLKFCVDASCAPFLHCTGDSGHVARTALSLQRSITPTHLTVRELAGSNSAERPFLVEVTYCATRTIHYHISTLQVVMGQEPHSQSTQLA